MDSELVWQNEEHAKYHDHEKDAHYTVRIPGAPPHIRGQEWQIITPDPEFFTPYRNEGNPTKEEAIRFAAEYTAAFGGAKVRVERTTYLPKPSADLVTMTRSESKAHALREAEADLERQHKRLKEQYGEPNA